MTSQNTNLTAADLTFGIEIETIAPDTAVTAHGLRIGPYKRGIQVPYLPQGWTAEKDGSIDNSAGGHKCEIVSPILKGAKGLQQVALVAEALTAKGHRVNKSTGVHIHIGWSRTNSTQALARLITITAYLEAALYAITGTKDRERGIYSKSVKQYGNATEAKKKQDADRYHALNLTNLANGTKNTVEFRVFSGTTSATKLIAWICLALGIVERSLQNGRNPVWAPKPLTGGWAKKGPGASEAERMMGYLAWGKGYAATKNGRTYGWIDNGRVTQDQAKAELRRLAEKYDEQA